MAGTTHPPLPLPDFSETVRILIVVAPYHREIADGLVQGARGVLDAAGAEHETVEVPGALEIPTAIRLAHRQADYDGYVALGCVIRGETTHYETVASDSARGLMFLGLDGACIGNGILTVENAAQAQVRAAPEGANKGGGAAEAALHLVALARQFRRQPKGIGFRSGTEGR